MDDNNNSNVSSKPNAWIDWFLSRKSAKIIDRQYKERLFRTFDATVEDEVCKDKLLNQGEIAFMFKTNFSSNMVNIIHHCQKIGGNIWRDEEHFGAIQGLRKDATCIITPNFDQLTQISVRDASVPDIEDILKVNTIEDINNLQNSPNEKFSARNVIPIPPFMLEKLDQVIQKNKGQCKLALLAAIESVRTFDRATEDITEIGVETARSSCRDILYWLFLANKNKIYSVPTMGCIEVEVHDHFRQLEHSRISSASDLNQTPITSQPQVHQDLQRPLEIIANSSSHTRDYLDKLTQMQQSSGDKNSRSFKRLAKKYQQMILVASSVGNVTAQELNEDGKEFFNQSSTLNAQIYLNSYLEAREIECTISSALATVLMHGSLTWSNEITPSGLAASVISSRDIINNDTLYEGIVLDYSIRHEISSESLKKLTKTQVLYPTDIESMIYRLDALTALCELFFGESSLIYKGLDEFVDECKKNKLLLRRRHSLDDMFIPKILYSVDDRVNQWLTQCAVEQAVNTTCLELVGFSNIITKIRLNEFQCYLPPSIKKIIKEDPSKKREADDSNNTKAAPKRNKQEATMIRNEDIVQEWKLRENEKWNLIFRHKTKDGPLLENRCQPCLKYQVKGFCFDDCKFKNTHHKLQGKDYTITDNYIKKLRM